MDWNKDATAWECRQRWEFTLNWSEAESGSGKMQSTLNAEGQELLEYDNGILV